MHFHKSRTESLGSPWFSRIPIKEVDDLGIKFDPLIFIFCELLLLTKTCYYYFFYLYGGAINLDVLLSEMCYCWRLDGSYKTFEQAPYTDYFSSAVAIINYYGFCFAITVTYIYYQYLLTYIW